MTIMSQLLANYRKSSNIPPSQISLLPVISPSPSFQGKKVNKSRSLWSPPPPPPATSSPLINLHQLTIIPRGRVGYEMIDNHLISNKREIMWRIMWRKTIFKWQPSKLRWIWIFGAGIKVRLEATIWFCWTRKEAILPPRLLWWMAA